MASNKFELHSVNTIGKWSLPLEYFKRLIFENQDAEFYFDDGLYSAYEFAAPHLEALEMTGTFAIISSLVNTEGYMTWAHINDLIDRGHEIANHTHTHQRLTEITFADNIQNEIEKCQKAIYWGVGYTCKKFVPPYNAFDGRVEHIVEVLGLELIKDRIATHETSGTTP